VCFLHALCHHTVKVRSERDWRRLILSVETQSEMHRAPGWHLSMVVERRLGTARGRIHGGSLTMHHISMKGIFGVGMRALKAEKPCSIRFILGKQARWCVTARQGLGLEIKTSERRMLGQHPGHTGLRQARPGPIAL